MLKTTHRITGVIVLTVLIYLSITGLMMQSIDLWQIVIAHHEPADPDILAMLQRQGGEFKILTKADNSAQPLPAALDTHAALDTVLKSARAALGDAPLRFVELRMLGGRLVGNVETREISASFDGVTGAPISQAPAPVVPSVLPIDTLRYRIKAFHRLTVLGNWALWINMIAGVALFAMAITGLTLYLRMWIERRKQGLSGFIWVGGGGKQEDWKRAMHRGVGLFAAILLLVVAFSGEWLAYESLVLGYRMQNSAQMRRAAAAQNRPSNNGAGQNGAGPNRPGGPVGAGANRNNQPQMLKDVDIPALLDVTLNAERQAANGSAIKVVRIRAFGNVQQGVVITGEGSNTTQLAFNAKTGQPVSGDPQTPGTGFPWGWDAHQLGKAIHRGSYFGVWARFLDFFAGLALLYLSINGLALYIDFKKERWQSQKANV
jgi:uncharacterized iron-regulated membrane protein